MMGLGLFWSFLGNSPIYGLHNRSSLCQVFPKQPEVWLPGHLCRWGAVESVDLWWGQVLFPQDDPSRRTPLIARTACRKCPLALRGHSSRTAGGEGRGRTVHGVPNQKIIEREKYPIPFITFPPFECGFSRWKVLLFPFTRKLWISSLDFSIQEFKKNLMNYLNVPFGLSK